MELVDADLQIRPATAADMPAVLEIYNEIVANTTAIFEETPRSLEDQQRWFAQKSAAGFPVFILEIAGRVAGYATYGPFRAWHCYQYTVEISLHLASADRGKGHGQHLLGSLIKDIRARRFHTVIAGVTADNTASLRLHRRFGFEKVGELKQVGRKFNRWLDLIFLQLTL